MCVVRAQGKDIHVAQVIRIAELSAHERRSYYPTNVNLNSSRSEKSFKRAECAKRFHALLAAFDIICARTMYETLCCSTPWLLS